MHHHVFSTALGPLALVWNQTGLRAISWGEGKNWSKTVAQNYGSEESELPTALSPWRDSLIAYSKTGKARFPQISFQGVSPFFSRVYRELQRTRSGEIVTYGELAKRAGSPRAARAVGEAMRKNPWVIAVPCHRVVRAGSSLGHYSGPGGENGKRLLLKLEGARIPE